MSGRLRFESPDAALALLDGYDPANGNWSFPRDGDFWAAIGEAHGRGMTGRGKRIAIVDSRFDLTVPALAAASGGRLAMGGPGAGRGHGTAVALLALTVAPDAALDLYSIEKADGADPYAVAEALRRVGRSTAVSVCLSLGIAVPHGEVAVGPPDEAKWAGYAGGAHWPSFRPAYCPVPEACLCDAADAVASPLRTVCAAVGNEEEGDGACEFCPALGDRVISIGFQIDRRTVVGNAGTARAALPRDYKQSTYVRATVKQPEGALGSSFAAPLIAGAAALELDGSALPAMALASQISGEAARTLADLRDGLGVDDHQVNRMLARFVEALERNPHYETLKRSDHWCVGCALFALAPCVNAGVAFWHQGWLREAEMVLRIARRIGPRNADAADTIARVLLDRANQGDGDRDALRAEAAMHRADAKRLGSKLSDST